MVLKKIISSNRALNKENKYLTITYKGMILKSNKHTVHYHHLGQLMLHNCALKIISIISHHTLSDPVKIAGISAKNKFRMHPVVILGFFSEL